MTEGSHKVKKSRTAAPALRPNHLAFMGMSLFCLALILRNSELAVRYMAYGLRLCSVSVIPALFPFMVLSELIVATGAVQLIGRLLARPFRFFFGIGGEGAGAALLGWLCGFPVGVRAAVSLCRRGCLDTRELSRLLILSSIPSSAFLIGTVGISLFGDRTLGVLLYAITILSSLLIGVGAHAIDLVKAKRGRASAYRISLSPAISIEPRRTPRSGVTVFTDAVVSSVGATLQICAFVLFFSVLSGTLSCLFSALALPSTLSCLLFGLLELTGGTAKAAELSLPLSEILCAFFVGWSGLSVHCQLMSLCSSVKVSLRSYWLAKCLHGLLNVLLLLLLRPLF